MILKLKQKQQWQKNIKNISKLEENNLKNSNKTATIQNSYHKFQIKSQKFLK